MKNEVYIIHGFRWFEKTNGNTYHTITIDRVSDKKRLFTSETMTYGYGEQYRHTAYDKLVDLGIAKEEDRYNHELNKQRFMYYVVDVPRKGDLF